MKNSKKLILYCILLGFFVSLIWLPAQGDKISSNEVVVMQNSKAVVKRYFSALSSGDIEAIRSVLGGNFLSRSGSLLSNPNYGEVLRNYFNRARFSIIGAEMINEQEIKILVEILLQDKSLSRVNLIVKDLGNLGFRIINESEIN